VGSHGEAPELRDVPDMTTKAAVVLVDLGAPDRAFADWVPKRVGGVTRGLETRSRQPPRCSAATASAVRQFQVPRWPEGEERRDLCPVCAESAQLELPSGASAEVTLGIIEQPAVAGGSLETRYGR
jgi:hypothetical protein